MYLSEYISANTKKKMGRSQSGESRINRRKKNTFHCNVPLASKYVGNYSKIVKVFFMGSNKNYGILNRSWKYWMDFFGWLDEFRVSPSVGLEHFFP